MMQPDNAERRRKLLRLSLIVAVAISLLPVVFHGGKPMPSCTINFRRQSTPTLFGVPLSDAHVRRWVFRGIGLLRLDVRICPESGMAIGDVVRTMDELKAARVHGIEIQAQK
jgi:hypothetical protein